MRFPIVKLSELQNWILRKLVFSYGSQWSLLKLIFLGGTLFYGYLGFHSYVVKRYFGKYIRLHKSIRMVFFIRLIN